MVEQIVNWAWRYNTLVLYLALMITFTYRMAYSSSMIRTFSSTFSVPLVNLILLFKFKLDPFSG